MLKKLGSSIFWAIAGKGETKQNNKVVIGEKLIIRLEDLSPVWLNYNSEFQPHPVKPSRTDEEIVELAKNGDTIQKTEKVETEINIVIPKTTQNTENKTKPIFKSSAFYDEVINPNADILQKLGVFDPIVKMVEYLDKYGGCPSVVGGGFDEEAQDLDALFYIFGKVTVRDHSFLVTSIAIKMLKEEQRDYQNLIPKTIIAALGHDFGKIPELRQSPIYVKADHAVISAEKVKEFFEGKEIFWLQSAIDAIKEHHRQSNDQFTLMIKSADAKARELEISQANQGMIKKWEEWFDLNRLLAIIKQHINVTQGAKWEAFTFGSVVYCMPDCAYASARKLMSEKNVIDMLFMLSSNKENAFRKISKVLREAGVLLDSVQEGYYASWYEIDFQQKNIKNKKMHLMPLKIEAFGAPSDVATLKSGTLSQIKDVKFANFAKGGR